MSDHHASTINSELCRPSEWSALHRLGFRFIFVYLALYNLPVSGQASLLDAIPFTGWLRSGLFWPMKHLSLWVGSRIVHLNGFAATFHPTSSGDTALSYVLAALIAVLAVVGTILWSLLDRRRRQYCTLEAWLRLLLAYIVGASLVGYGFAKLFPVQFQPPGLLQLTKSYGESTPMNLLWTFMGASAPYTVFAGLVEVVAGLLLFYRRTRTVGGLLAITVITNIVLLNFCYDVPVKLYSLHLLLMTLYLLSPDLPLLARLLLRGQWVRLQTDDIAFANRRELRAGARVLQILFVLSVCGRDGLGAWQARPLALIRSPLYGVWHVETISGSPPMPAWTQMIFESPSGATVKRSDNSTLPIALQPVYKQHLLYMWNKEMGGGTSTYDLDPAHPREMQLRGDLHGRAFTLDLHRTNPDPFPLEAQRFHWVHELPPNQ